MLGFLAAMGHAGDQFTFGKPPHADLEALYGARVEEMTVYRTLEAHLLAHANAGRPVLLEGDAHWLPDTAGTEYRCGHSKTTVAVLSLDPAAGQAPARRGLSRPARAGACPAAGLASAFC
jgi:hypothetical protein